VLREVQIPVSGWFLGRTRQNLPTLENSNRPIVSLYGNIGLFYGGKRGPVFWGF